MFYVRQVSTGKPSLTSTKLSHHDNGLNCILHCVYIALVHILRIYTSNESDAKTSVLLIYNHGHMEQLHIEK